MTPKRILIFSLAYYPDHISGAEIAIKEITDRIDRDSIEFHVVTLFFSRSAPRRERIGNVEVHRVGWGGRYLSKILFVPLAAIKARLLERSMGIDAVWCMMTYMLFPLTLARMIGLRSPHMLTLQDGDPYDKVFKRWFIRPLTPLLDYGFRSATIIQAISHYLAEWPRKRGYTGPIEVIPNAVDINHFAQVYTDEERESLKQRLGKKDGDVFLITTSRLVEKNACDDVIKALQELPKYVHFLILGIGPDEKKLKRLARECGVEHRVHFLGFIKQDVLPLYLQTSDIFIRPSLTEGLGSSFLEAMAAGLPVVATPVGGIPDFLEHEKTGLFCAVRDPDSITKQVCRLINEPELKDQIVTNAGEMVRERYDWDIVAEEMKERVFDKIGS